MGDDKLGPRVAAARKAQALSQNELAALIRDPDGGPYTNDDGSIFGGQHINMIERTGWMPPYAVLRQLEMALGIYVEDCISYA